MTYCNWPPVETTVLAEMPAALRRPVPTGRVYRLRADGRLDCLLSNGPSPNGFALTPDESALFVAMTRDNAVWRLPLLADGSTSKVGRFAQFHGTSGPDGMAMDLSLIHI